MNHMIGKLKLSKLSPTDSPQLGTLPDITIILRAMFLQTDLIHGFILTPLYAALPCIRSVKPKDSQKDTHQVAIRILLGLLLGLYPTAVRFPPFPVRVALYRRIHCLLTNGKGVSFCQSHPSLLALSLMEYTAYVIPAYLPVEHDLLLAEFGMPNFFATCSLTCDAFRQEVLDTGEEPWERLEAYCLPIVERHSKACKSRQRIQAEQFPIVKHCLDTVDLPFIVPYAIHTEDPTSCIMASEMAFLGPNYPIYPDRTDPTPRPVRPPERKPHEENDLSTRPTGLTKLGLTKPPTKAPNLLNAVAVQRTIHTHQLPPNLTDLQLRALSSSMRVCERSALSGSVLYVCVSCVMANQQTICRKGRAFPTRGQCKYDLNSEDLVCSVCQSHSIIAISTLGRIISIRNYRFYLAPCCCTVQIYTGRGDEFQFNKNQTCPHRQVKSPKPVKRRCELCPNVAVADPHSSVDHLTGEQHFTYLCQRHTPHVDALKHVTNWSQLQEEIRKRDRPLFSIRNAYKGK